MSLTTDNVYAVASDATGKGIGQLRSMAVDVFASMLHHAMADPRRYVWTALRIDGGQIDLEVDVTRRRRPLEDVVREHVLLTLARHDGHRRRTAESLGVGLRTLGLWLKAWGVPRGGTCVESGASGRVPAVSGDPADRGGAIDLVAGAGGGGRAGVPGGGDPAADRAVSVE